MDLPDKMLKWNFYGEGLESLKLEEAPVPTPEPDQILVRQDACGLCFSDTKVIALGKDHPRMVGRNLAANPVTLGHEVSCTVVAVGEDVADRFRVGDRFIVQADVFYKGVSMAYGYVISGGLAEYSIIPHEMIEGDEGCYLLPIQPRMGVVETALVEPWACVVAAYNQAHRPGMKPGGRLLVVAGEGAQRLVWDGALPEEKPATVVCIGGVEAGASLRAALGGGVVLTTDLPADWAALKRAATGTAGFDDVLLLGDLAPEVLEGAASALADHGIACIVRQTPIPRKLSLDIGRIHYNWHHYVGTTGSTIAEAYRETRPQGGSPGLVHRCGRADGPDACAARGTASASAQARARYGH
jgi:NADPH:quinone reductase-like Zn-dependent oxidoreductase